MCFIVDGELDAVTNENVTYVGDVNDDGYEDFAIGDSQFGGADGRVVVYY